ncbi:MAG TPA: hypothetical protein VGQ56_02425 [Gemmatimonadaceae bacterium]|nr:hypothetical protein [Gemmatimonadaceae bacterium]
MSPSDRPKPGPRPQTPRPAPSTLAKAVGGLPLPPRIAKPPDPRVFKPLGPSPAKPSTARPRAAHPSKPSADHVRGSVAGRLGTFNPKRPIVSRAQDEPRQRGY